MQIIIKQISTQKAYTVRHPVLRTSKPIDSCKMEGDDLDSTYHFGLFYNEKLVAVATFMDDKNPEFNEANQYRLRGMAVLNDYQGKGFGKQLLNHGERFLKTKNSNLMWCNARIVALNFYKNNGYTTHGALFNIPKVGPHYTMFKTL